MFKIEIKGLNELTQRLERMARDVESEAARLNQTVVSTPLACDENGFVDRQCPRCSFFFKMATDNKSGDVRACPSCGYRGLDARWETPAQFNRGMMNAQHHVGRSLDAAFSGMRRAPAGIARWDIGLRPAYSQFIRSKPTARTQSINLMRGSRWIVTGLPAPASAALRTERTCFECGCRFSFIGAAFFCPGCGTSSARVNFAQTIAQIRNSIAICQTLRDKLSADDAANLERDILEKAMADIVTGFQLVAELIYEAASGTKAPLNAFQRLDGDNSGNTLWLAVTGKSYNDYLGEHGFAKLKKYFQRRHLLSHQNGFVEQRYINRSGDTSYAVGQRLVVRASEVEDLVCLVEKLITGMQDP